MIGPIFSIITAACFAMSSVVGRRGVLYATPLQGMYVTVIAGVPLFLIAAAVSGQMFRLSVFSGADWILLLISGLTNMIIGRYCNYRATRALGANGSTPLRSFAVLVAVVTAIVFLDEELTLARGFGVALLVLAPLLMLERRSTPTAVPSGGAGPETSKAGAAEPIFIRRQAEGYFFGLATAVGYGSSPLFMRMALEDSGMGVAGGLISYLAAAGVMLLLLALPGQVANVRGMNRAAIPWFAAGTVSSFLAHMFRYVAISLAPVTVVAPLVETNAMFTVAYSYVLNRKTEIFNVKTLAAIGLSMVGATLLVAGL
ncbi:MAG: Permease of the drug/metabolite transporter (DMT) superfamily [Chloroflexi bacterium]|jgi:drug/metabolite transporter (DMT)-like permease|nr:MAG: Permease of the drug/metabolite transporter (DMT) superfamily [Chloroflexota bacterium]